MIYGSIRRNKLNYVERYITYPLAIQVFKQDFETSRTYEVGSLYMDLVESIIGRLQDDFLNLKAELFSVHHLDVKKITNKKYRVNNEMLEFTSEELKEMTRELIGEYLFNTEDIERKSRPWKNGRYE